MVDVIGTEEFADWFESLGASEARAVARKVDLLEFMGVALGYPHSSSLKGSRIALRELRIQAEGSPIRVFYAFDPTRRAVLLIGGDKTADERFYQRLIPEAERLWQRYLAELKKEEPL